MRTLGEERQKYRGSETEGTALIAASQGYSTDSKLPFGMAVFDVQKEMEYEKGEVSEEDETNFDN